MSIACASCGSWMADITRLSESTQRLRCVNAQCPSNEPLPDSIGMGQLFGARLVEILGLSGQKVSSIHFDFEAGKPVMMTVRRFATHGQAKALAQVLEEFECRLAPRPGHLRVEPLPTSEADAAAEPPRASDR